jgi:hypothetical protein
LHGRLKDTIRQGTRDQHRDRRNPLAIKVACLL